MQNNAFRCRFTVFGFRVSGTYPPILPKPVELCRFWRGLCLSSPASFGLPESSGAELILGSVFRDPGFAARLDFGIQG